MHATETQRKRLFIDLIDILAQLRKLEFTSSGSLMPNPDGNESNPIVGPFLSMTANEFERSYGESVASENFTTVKHFTDFHCNILTETYRLPVEELDHRQAKEEIFALESVLKELPNYIDPQEHRHPFILAHPDLRCGNLIVDNDFSILGVIDWEFTSSIPLRMFTPPSWITGHDPDMLRIITGTPRGKIFLEFCKVLEERRSTSNTCAQLCQDWALRQGQTEGNGAFLLGLSPIVQILRHPSSLVDIFYSSIFRRLFGPAVCQDAAIRDFFDHHDNEKLTEQVEIQVEKSERYTEYLKSQGLLVDDDQSRRIREFLERTKHLV
ncbi:phosphotransferase enzyme family protein, partial [Metarhizium majus ARSEF 297]